MGTVDQFLQAHVQNGLVQGESIHWMGLLRHPHKITRGIIEVPAGYHEYLAVATDRRLILFASGVDGFNVKALPKAGQVHEWHYDELAAVHVACLQELPDPIPADLVSTALGPRGLAASVPTLNGRRVMFVHSASMQHTIYSDTAHNRMQIVEWSLASGTTFLAAGLHAVDRIHHSQPEVRGGYGALTRGIYGNPFGSIL